MYKQEASRDLPEIELNSSTGLLSFKGRSIPKDAGKEYSPVINWIDNYIENAVDKTVVELRLEYFNTGTSKLIFDILQRIVHISESGKNEVAINWYYKSDDIDLKEHGIRFSNLLDFKINLIGY